MALSATIRHDVGFLSTLPLGAIIAWHRDLDTRRPAPLPPGWVECNGQTLDDPESPYHGLQLPNLNGQPESEQRGVFLRGGPVSGVRQEDQLQSHKHDDRGHRHNIKAVGGSGPTVQHWYNLGVIPAPSGGTVPTETSHADLGNPTETQAGPVRHGTETRPVNMSVIWILKVKQITAARALPAVLAHEEAPHGAVYVGADGRVGVGTSEPARDTRLDVQGRIRGAGTAEAWSAERTGFVVVEGVTPWTDIPGLAVDFELSGRALVQVSANGSQRAAGGRLHVAYRLVVDDAPRGGRNHGQRLLVTDEAVNSWEIWSLTGFEKLESGPHTLRVQTRQSLDWGTGVVCGDRGPAMADHAGGVLNLLAVYQ